MFKKIHKPHANDHNNESKKPFIQPTVFQIANKSSAETQINPSTQEHLKGNNSEKSITQNPEKKDPAKLIELRGLLEYDHTLDTSILKLLASFSSEESTYIIDPLMTKDKYMYDEKLKTKLIPANYKRARQILDKRLIRKEATYIATKDMVLSYGESGIYDLGVKWDTNAKNGYIVQRILAKYTAKDKNDNELELAMYISPKYWEAWTIKDGEAVESKGAKHDDLWENPPAHVMLGLNKNIPTKGKWSMRGTLYFVNNLDIEGGGWKKGHENTNAGFLLSTTQEPVNLGEILGVRSSYGWWDNTSGAKKYGIKQQ